MAPAATATVVLSVRRLNEPTARDKVPALTSTVLALTLPVICSSPKPAWRRVPVPAVLSRVTVSLRSKASTAPAATVTGNDDTRAPLVAPLPTVRRPLFTLAPPSSATLARTTEMPSLLSVTPATGLLTLPPLSAMLPATAKVALPCKVPASVRLLTPPPTDSSSVAKLETAKSDALDSEPAAPPTSVPAATRVVPL